METPNPMIPPVTVTMVGNGTGDGGAPIPNNTEAKTPDHQPNVIVKVVTPLMAIGVRAVNVFLTVFLSLTGIGNLAHVAIGDGMPAIDFHTALMFAGLAALGEGLKSLLTITTGLEKKYPLGTGSV